jgi:hypothetical protein
MGEKNKIVHIVLINVAIVLKIPFFNMAFALSFFHEVREMQLRADALGQKISMKKHNINGEEVKRRR